MKFKYEEITINMERTQSVVTNIVPAWEVPVIQAVHPNTAKVADVVYERGTLSVSSEYNRLAKAYGAEREEGGAIGRPYIESVYGAGNIGIAALKQAMLDSRLPESTPVTPVRASPELRQDLLQELDKGTDDLIGDETETEETDLV